MHQQLQEKLDETQRLVEFLEDYIVRKQVGEVLLKTRKSLSIRTLDRAKIMRSILEISECRSAVSQNTRLANKLTDIENDIVTYYT